MALERLKDHYKHCIRLSASNKINPKNAFDLQLIDYMQDLVSTSEDGQLNFKIASSALDVGAKIYSNRVDCIQSEAQKVASSILMALDGQQPPNKSGQSQNESQCDEDATANSDQLDDSTEGGNEEDRAKVNKKKRPTRNKNVKTVIEDENQLDAKLEKMVLGDPFLDGLSQDYDMSCPAALISYNALNQPSGLLTIESSNLRKDYREKDAIESHSDPPNNVTLITKNVNCAQILRNNQHNHICPRLENFLFNDRTTAISGLNSNLDESTMPKFKEQPILNSSRTTGGVHEFNPEVYEGANDDYDDADSNGPDLENKPIDLNLDRIASSKPTEYGYHRLVNTWAGPHAWKALKAPLTAKKDTAPKSCRKRFKLEQKPINFEEEIIESLEEEADKEIRHSADVIRKWKKPLLPQDHNLTEETVRAAIFQTFLRPEDTYHCMKTPADVLKLVDKDHDYTKTDRNMDEANDLPNSPGLGGFDNVHDDSDDEFRADPVVDGNEVAIYGEMNNTLTQHADLEFAGENLIDQPYTVAQVNIPFAKIAKKMDVRKLKRVMWDLLFPPEKRTDATHANQTIANEDNDVTLVGGDEPTDNTVVNSVPSKKTPSPTPSEAAVHLEFSNLYGELPVRVSSKMASDLSQPIAFVTLLHLANEKNLKLIPKQDLKDFIIEQDEVI